MQIKVCAVDFLRSGVELFGFDTRDSLRKLPFATDSFVRSENNRIDEHYLTAVPIDGRYQVTKIWQRTGRAKPLATDCGAADLVDAAAFLKRYEDEYERERLKLKPVTGSHPRIIRKPSRLPHHAEIARRYEACVL